MGATVSLARLMSGEGRRNPFRYYAWLHEHGYDQLLVPPRAG